MQDPHSYLLKSSSFIFQAILYHSSTCTQLWHVTIIIFFFLVSFLSVLQLKRALKIISVNWTPFGDGLCGVIYRTVFGFIRINKDVSEPVASSVPEWLGWVKLRIKLLLFCNHCVWQKNLIQSHVQSLKSELINTRHRHPRYLEKYMINVHFLLNFRLQVRRNFGERVLSTFLTKIMAAIFHFNGSGRLGREGNLYQGDGRRSKKRSEVGMGKWRLRLPEVIVILQNSVPWRASNQGDHGVFCFPLWVVVFSLFPGPLPPPSTPTPNQTWPVR